MKRNAAKVIVKLLFIIALIGATTSLGTQLTEACKDCMLVWIQGQAEAGCYSCGRLGHTWCEPAGGHCNTSGILCDPQQSVPAPVCPPVS